MFIRDDTPENEDVTVNISNLTIGGVVVDSAYISSGVILPNKIVPNRLMMTRKQLGDALATCISECKDSIDILDFIRTS